MRQTSKGEVLKDLKANFKITEKKAERIYQMARSKNPTYGPTPSSKKPFKRKSARK